MHSSSLELFAEIEQKHWWFAARRRIIGELVRQVLPAGEGRTIVDVGCGTGGNIASFADDYRCLGIDASRRAVQLARNHHPRVRFICGDAPDDLDETARTAHLLMMNDVLEHAADDVAMLEGIVVAAKPGTFFLLTVPADPSMWSPHDETNGHFRRYTREDFQGLWQGLPVTTILLSYYNARLYHVVKLIRTLNRWRGEPSGDAGLDLQMPSPIINRCLRHIFSGEAKVLNDLLRNERCHGYRRGVSLVALLRKDRDGSLASQVQAQGVEA